ncbi:hypothetical protein JTE90_013373 [Oedothorax gibbosus]|uniref:ZSWIM1/3 RNaseH-like domain-containing protein n=1 Tax=Oedothorax gibbosus TaxID=931172 RepID=A0AAV6TUY0_9ARAC|nr:hypothetical protein JTE90_013373 [Oedothorax gibbosus]
MPVLQAAGSIKKKFTNGSRQTKTFRQDCSATINVLLSADKQFLEIKSMNMEHDHDISEALFRQLPKERRLPADYQVKVQHLMDLQVNKKLLQEQIVKETGKGVTLKDLSNIAAKGQESSNFEILSTLKNVHGCSVSALKDNEDTLQGLFFQDKEMKKMYNNYPEVVFFDGTYKLLNINFTCYVFLIEDGNGSSEIVGVGLLARENKESVRWLTSSFKESNSEWPKTRVVMTDKDFTERLITPEKMGVTKEICNTAKEYLTKLAYCQTEESDKSLYESFKNVAPATIMKYYDDNWHDIRKEWNYMCCSNGDFLNTTNNRLESINGKIKTVVRKFSSFPGFVSNLFSMIRSMRQERDHVAATTVLKRSVSQFPGGSAEGSYQNLLNPYPFELVLKQINMSKDPKTTAAEDGANFTYLGGMIEI